MYVIRFSKRLADNSDHTHKPDGAFLTSYQNNKTKKLEITPSVRMNNAMRFNTEDEATEFYKNVLINDSTFVYRRFHCDLAAYVVEAEVITKVVTTEVVKMVGSTPVRQL